MYVLEGYNLVLVWVRGDHSRGDLGLEKDEDEDEYGGDTGGEHEPHREGLVLSKRVDEPPSLGWVGHRQALRNHQFLSTRKAYS